MSYLDVLKDKVSDMEVKVRETQNERNFYKQKYLESDALVTELREKEKESSISFAKLQAQNEHLL